MHTCWGIGRISRPPNFSPAINTFSRRRKQGLTWLRFSVETPYGQVVELGEAALNTDIQGVEEKWAGKPFPFIVRVGVDLTDTYPGPPPWNPRAPGLPLPNFERDFEIQIIQNHKKIPATSSQVYLLYSDAIANTYQISGAIIELRYDTDSIDPYDEATITVHTPDDQHVETSFDLGDLR
jgi:hypothetical protein